MKWGKKKCPSASSHPSLITHVFPSAWFSKFKQKRSSFEPKSPAAASKQKVQQSLPSSYSLSFANSWKEGRFYCEDDPYWRLSFGEEGGQERSKVWLNSVWDHPNDDEHGVAVPNSGSSKPESVLMVDDIVSDARMAREMQEKVGCLLENERKSTYTTAKNKKSRKVNRRTVDEKQERGAKVTEKAVFEVQPEEIIHMTEDFSMPRDSESRYRRSFSFPNSNQRTVQEECIFKTLNLETFNAISQVEDDGEEIISQCKRLEDMKIQEMTEKTEQPRESFYSSPRKRRKQMSRTKCFSPRTTAKIECKIRALEDMKKAKMRKKKTKETAQRDRAIFESYAVAKSSFNPQKDFRDSMIEMIMEKGIETPEELEELLACYLTLNYDEYHDLIIKVFRQVYFELNQVYFASKMQNISCND